MSKILDFVSPKQGTSRPCRWIVTAVALLVVAGLGLSHCSTPTLTVANTPNPAPAPVPTSKAITTSSTAASLTNDVEIIVPQRRHVTSQEGLKPAEHSKKAGGSSRVSAPDEEPIIIRIKQTTTAAATADANASASPMLTGHAPMTQDHARLGAFVGTVPGVIALTYQLAAVEFPPWALGTRLSVGLDAAVNLEAAAVGVTAGSKAFVGGYGWSRWSLSEQGWALGIGMRF